jgi:hypothetical protein
LEEEGRTYGGLMWYGQCYLITGYKCP